DAVRNADSARPEHALTDPALLRDQLPDALNRRRIVPATQAVQGYGRRAGEPHRDEGPSAPPRGGAGPNPTTPRPRPPAPRQAGANRDRNRAGQADLSAMRVAGEQQVEIGGFRLTVDLRRVRQQNRKRSLRD